jgi:hypothetical protein
MIPWADLLREHLPVPITPPPPWDAPEAVMVKWVNEQLDAFGSQFLRTTFVQEIEEDDAQGCLDNFIHWAEKTGDISGLRDELIEVLPTLAKTPAQARGLKYIAENFLHLPQRKWQRYSKEDDPVAGAIQDAMLIRLLWRQFYGKRNRPNSLVAAETIAAKRNKTTVTKILNRQKHRAKA